MSSKERKSKPTKSLRQIIEGPSVEEFETELTLRAEVAKARQQQVEYLQEVFDGQMEETHEYLRDLNLIAKGSLFYEFSDNDAVLITRSKYVYETDDGYKGMHLLIAKKGFYGLEYPLKKSSDGQALIPTNDNDQNLNSILENNEVLNVYHSLAVAHTEKLLFYIFARDGRKAKNYTSELSEPARRLDLADMDSIKTCLHQAFVEYEYALDADSEILETIQRIERLQNQNALVAEISDLVVGPQSDSWYVNVFHTIVNRFGRKKKKR